MRQTFLLILFLSFFSCKSDKKEHSLMETTNKIGIKKFKVADKNIKDSIVEYIKIDGNEYANQIWLISKTNDTIGGNYFNSYINDTTKLGEVTRLRFVLTKPTIDWASEMFVVLPYDDDELKSDFSNLREIKLDTFHSLKNDEIPHLELNELDLPLNHITEFGLDYENPGKKRVRGIVVERGKKYNKKYERRLFFDESLYIKE
ncbi:hypothetical protein PXC01_15525 [Maribacter sp. M208]|uniref:hypothetical protein n=1 Tax=Maribacter huludaoensis TaxID=3030010 RepID=UPI0023ECE3C4|nr:hypothetical protein [Maribacter huludaoensis]MDF4223014.1 hypothetical protein [Maribacter huludaoensis]